jgi:hypothetical protein
MVINIGWEFFLIIMGTLLGIAWYSGYRFSALETSVQWLKDTIRDLKVAHSPVNLNATGEFWLTDSGMKEYLDTNKDEMLKVCEEKRNTNPYEVQNHIFKYFDTMDFKDNFEDKLKKFAFDKGITMSIIRRIGAIYFRNLCLNYFGMNTADIDKHDPVKPKEKVLG